MRERKRERTGYREGGKKCPAETKVVWCFHRVEMAFFPPLLQDTGKKSVREASLLFFSVSHIVD